MKKLYLIIIVILIGSCTTTKKVTKTDRIILKEKTTSLDSASNVNKKTFTNKDLSYKFTLTEIDSSSSIPEKIKDFEDATGIKLNQNQINNISENAKNKSQKGESVVLSSFTLIYNESSTDTTKSESSVNKQENSNEEFKEEENIDETIKKGGKFKTWLILILIISVVAFLIVLQIKGIGIKSIFKNLFQK